MMHHDIECVPAGIERQAASLHQRGKQARNAQIERDGQRTAEIHAEGVADKIAAVGEQIRQIIVAHAQERAKHHNNQQIRHGFYRIPAFQTALVKLAARIAGQQDQRAQHKQRQRVLQAGEA